MPKSKMNKPSSLSSRPRARNAQPQTAAATPRPGRFSIFDFKFATPPNLRALLHLAACLALIPTLQLPAQAGTGSLWKEGTSRSIFSDRRARAIGDILTILVQENNTASKENSTKTSKSSSVDASLDTLLYSPAIASFLSRGGKLPAMKFGGSQSFDGGGKINNSENITARIAVHVADVLPNGNMIIEGRRETFVSGEKQEAVLRGVVRGEDVAANNTVFSYNVDSASIRFVSKGTLSDNTRKGWLHRVWEKVTPF